MRYFLDTKDLSKEQKKLLEKHFGFFTFKEMEFYHNTCIKIDNNKVTGYSCRGFYCCYPEVNFDEACKLLGIKENVMLNDVKALFANLDQDTFEKFCSDGQEAILDFCKKYDIDTSDFAPEKSYFFNIETVYLEVPSGVDPDEITFQVRATLPDGSVVEVDIDTVENTEK